MHGWKCAQDIQPGDHIMATSAAMRMVRGSFHSQICIPKNAEVLRSILLSEMEDATARDIKGCSHKRNSSKDWAESFCMVEEWRSWSRKADKEDKRVKSDVEPGDEEEIITNIASDEAQTFRSWGKWSRDDIASAINDGCVVRELDTGICYITGKTATRFSNMLQGRLRESRLKNSNRDRRTLPQIENGQGQKEGYEAEFFRVESSEVLELGDSRLDEFRDAEGKLYFYDIKAKRHPSFSVNGALVHNSSILKSFTSSTRNMIIDRFASTPYKLACTATPAPNDFMEIGNHAEFLGIMTRTEMLSMFFVHDGGETSKWRLKGHANNAFWKWMASWAMVLKKPSDIGFCDYGFELPELDIQYHVVDHGRPLSGFLFKDVAVTLDDQRKARKESIPARLEKLKEIITNDDQWLVWCDLNDESSAIKKNIHGFTEVKGSDSPENKESALSGFANGSVKRLVTKTSISGFGMNYQACQNMIFFGLSHSYESFYQAVRRCWRYGQKKPVNVHVIISDIELPIVENIERKHKQAETMSTEMVRHMSDYMRSEITMTTRETTTYNQEKKIEIPKFMKG